MSATHAPNLSIDLRPGYHEFACLHCGHRVGDTKRRNWTGTCPACERTTRFCRIIV